MKSKKIIKALLAALIFIFVFTNCNKDEDEDDGWNKCYSCSFNSWRGDYSGTCAYADQNNNINDMSGLPITITIDSAGVNYLSVLINVENYYSTNISGQFIDPSIVNMAGSSSSFAASLYVKESQMKLSGNSKKFHIEEVIENGQTVDRIVYDEVITFEILKN